MPMLLQRSAFLVMIPLGEPVLRELGELLLPMFRCGPLLRLHAAKRAAEVPGSCGSMKRRTLGGVTHALGCLAATSSRVAVLDGDDGDGPDFGSETSLVPYSVSSTI